MLAAQVAPGDNHATEGFMVTRRGMLALVSALCVQASAIASADMGAYEALVRDRTLRNLRAVHAGDSVPDEVSVRFAACFASATVRGFTPEEIAQLNTAATGGPTNYDLWKRAEVRRNYLYNGNLDYSKLEPFCPNDLADFNRYRP
jgi:hypothetical protein